VNIYKYGDDSQQYGQLIRPKNNHYLPVVIVIHGGYWKDNHSLDTYPTKHIVEYLKGFNIAIWNLEYRRMNSLGANVTAPWPSILNDVGEGVDFLSSLAEQHKLDLSKMTLIGHSAGGHLATWAASRAMINPCSILYKPNYLTIKSVISIAGVLDLRRAEDLGQPEQIIKLLNKNNNIKTSVANSNPAQLVDANVRYIIVHGDMDKEVNINQALSFIECACLSKVVLHILKEDDHFTMFPGFAKNQRSWEQLKKIIYTELQVTMAGNFKASVLQK